MLLHIRRRFSFIVAAGIFIFPLIASGEEESDRVATWMRQASAAAGRGDSQQAVDLASKVIAVKNAPAEAYYLRGRERFRLGKFTESVADFDRYVDLRPELATRQWERGIALYYAKRFADGAKQFGDYQRYHSNDVENSAWRFLCVARTAGLEKARAELLPIRDDPRVPMMQIYQLYRGQLTPQDVLAAATPESSTTEIRQAGLFYAHLYLGLYYEAGGNTELAKRYISLAAANENKTARVNRFMWDVARVHAEQFEAQAR